MIKNHSSKSPGGLENMQGVFRHVKYEHLIAGISGGAISTLILHPLDLLKIRFAGKCEFFSSLFILANTKSF